MILVDISGASAAIRKQDVLTAGMVGAVVEFRFDDDWKGLAKTAVFRAGDVTKDAIVKDSVSKIPHEVLIPGVPLEIGVYGTKDDGDIVIPTVWAKTNLVRDGVDPSGDEGADPSLPFWAELQEQLEKGELKGEKGEKGDKGDPGEKGDKGDRGNPGIYIGSGDMPADCSVQIDPNGDPLTVEKIIADVIAALPVYDGEYSMEVV